LNGATTYTITQVLSAGGHTFTVKYNEDGADGNYAQVQNSVSVTVGQASTTQNGVTSSLSASTYGQAVTFSSSVSVPAPGSGVPTGTITFYAENTAGTNLGSGTVDGTGHATITFSVLPAGVHHIVAVYNGDSSFAASTASASVTLSVAKAHTTPAIVVSNPSVYGQPVLIVVTTVLPGAGIPTGVVTFFDKKKQIGTGKLNFRGQVAFPTTHMWVGKHSLTATYAGDANFLPSVIAKPRAQVIVKDRTTTKITSSLNPSPLGKTVTLTATILPVAPGSRLPKGTVLWKKGTTLLSTSSVSTKGTSTLSLPNLPLGSTSITAQYVGNTNYIASSATFVQTVREPSTTTLKASTTSGLFGQAITFTTTVTSPFGTPSGKVVLKDGTVTIGSGNLDAHGKAKIIVSTLSRGAHSVTAIYNGNTVYVKSSSTVVSETIS